MNTYEYFQNNSESDLNSAYNNVSLNDSMHNVPFCNANNNAGPLPTTTATQEPIEKSTMSNLWDFLGLTNLSTEKKECLFDCSIHGARCLERCKFKDPEKCKYRCLKHGLYCSKKCVMSVQDETNNKCINPTTHSGNANNQANNHANNHSHANNNDNNNGNNNGNNNANNANNGNHSNNNANANNANNSNQANNNAKYPPLPRGNQPDYMGYAPFDSSLWPSYTQSGWDMEKLNKPDRSLFIEVLVPNQFIYPEETDKPSLLF